MAEKTTWFNFDAALEAVAADAFARAFLETHRAALEELTAAAVSEILDLFVAGRAREAMLKFYAAADWQVIADGAAKDVANAADMAEAAAAVRARLNGMSVFAAKALLSVILAGFCL